jgi:hypothetical protein
MKIFVEMTEEEYDKYREYLYEKEFESISDTDPEELEEARVIEGLKKVIKNSQYLERLAPRRKYGVGCFERSDVALENNLSERQRKNLETVLRKPDEENMNEEETNMGNT